LEKTGARRQASLYLGVLSTVHDIVGARYHLTALTPAKGELISLSTTRTGEEPGREAGNSR